MMIDVTGEERTAGRGPTRTCAGCRMTAGRGELVRFAVSEDPPYLAPDLYGRLPGRGVSVHPTRPCITAAVKAGGFARVIRRPVPFGVDEITSLLVGQLERRMEGLVSSARRARALAAGTDVAAEAIENGTAKLLVVAADARGRKDDLEAAARRHGLPISTFGTKNGLGALVGRDEVGFLAVLDEGIAAEFTRAAARRAALSEVE